MFGHTIRFRSSENVIEEIEHCIKKYGIYDFRINDDSFTLNKKRIIKLCRQIIEKKLNITWNCYSRVQDVNFHLLRLMKRAGCYHIKFGIESGSEKVLKKLNKTFTLEEAKKAIDLTKKVGIETKTMFMLGTPGETIKDMEQTIKFAKYVSSDISTFLIFTPLPGSQLYYELNKENKIKHSKWSEFSQQGNYLVDSFDNKTIKKYFKKAYLEFYFRPKYFIQRFKKILKEPKEELRLIFKGIRILLPLIK